MDEESLDAARENARQGMASPANQERDRKRKAAPEGLDQNRRAKMARGSKSTSIKPFDARLDDNVGTGEKLVPGLADTDDSIGGMTVTCEHCGALKWKRETATTCCCEGKFSLNPLETPPPVLNKMWFDQSPRAKLFRLHSRAFNNALCLSSIKVSERRFTGFNPSVVFQGKVFQYCGSIVPEDGAVPRFCQLYILDPSLEDSRRVGNMNLPRSVTPGQKEIITEIMVQLEAEITSVNPFVSDFKMISELDDDQLTAGKLVISAKAPVGQHERRYNEQLCLQEVRIVTNNAPHDLVLYKRGGGLQVVSDQNPSALPLHFTLLFPHGTKGWDQTETRKDGKKRITAREFFAFRTNVRDKASDYLFMAGRLFQEFLCFAWVTVENQRLSYQRQNQKALRADSFRNIRDVVAARQRVPLEDRLGGDTRTRVGRSVILASSFIGSPRWFNAQLQDGM
jgi:hypothetical protein